ncbi:hypothetical protein [Paenibacillus chitinolyticus]
MRLKKSSWFREPSSPVRFPFHFKLGDPFGLHVPPVHTTHRLSVRNEYRLLVPVFALIASIFIYYTPFALNVNDSGNYSQVVFSS